MYPIRSYKIHIHDIPWLSMIYFHLIEYQTIPNHKIGCPGQTETEKRPQSSSEAVLPGRHSLGRKPRVARLTRLVLKRFVYWMVLPCSAFGLGRTCQSYWNALNFSTSIPEVFCSQGCLGWRVLPRMTWTAGPLGVIWAVSPAVLPLKDAELWPTGQQTKRDGHDSVRQGSAGIRKGMGDNDGVW